MKNQIYHTLIMHVASKNASTTSCYVRYLSMISGKTFAASFRILNQFERIISFAKLDGERGSERVCYVRYQAKVSYVSDFWFVERG